MPDPSLTRIVFWLDHAVEIGTSRLALGPIFSSSSHGYDTVDPFRINPRLGDEGDFVRLVRAAHDRGMRILLDGVFNHVGRDFARILTDGADAPDQDWFVLHWPADATSPQGYDMFEGHPGLVELNHTSPAVLDSWWR